MDRSMHVSTWGRGGLGNITVRWRQHAESPLQATVRSIERRTGLVICGGPCSQGQDLDRHGRVESSHYSATLGRRCRRGGYNVVGEIWFAIPRE